MHRYPGARSQEERRVTDSEKSRCVAVFRECDLGQKGYLTREDLKIAVVMMFGYKPSKVETDILLASVQEKHLPGRNFLTVEDFKRAFAKVTPHLPDQTVLEAFREVDRDSDGRVSFRDFEAVMDYQ
ncbi:EF-hand calcium-binding domain-containing protein 11 isoform X9 [Hypanus sabinus]|uniref:EF-hand calcium-binding domain-containing protein 11 isoform X9 n=1 Tax=Hypanus sabinus TaxID=79690 RepID=UPI0028C50692|nr:EF-hand calcium-binding domain-containing protein 11 isoform X9 [Hypanus sabinus]